MAVLHTPGSPAPDPAAAGVHHIAYTYIGLGDLLATHRRLKAGGIEADGLPVELQIDNFATFDDLVRRPPLPPGKTPLDMRAER